jgi:type IV pilus assembly protein PilB
MNEKTIKILLEEAALTPEQLAQVREEQRRSGTSLQITLDKIGLGEEKIVKILSEKFRIPMVDWSSVQINPEVLSIVPEEKARKYLVFPLSVERMERRQGRITLAMVDPLDLATLTEISFMTGCNIKPMIASESSILNAIKKYYGMVSEKIESPEEKESGGPMGVGLKSSILEEKASPIKGIEELRTLAKDLAGSIESLEEKEEVIPAGPENQADKWLVQILTQAFKKGVSEVHLDPHERGLTARYRIDGILYNFGESPPGLKKAVISALKQRGQIPAPTDKVPYQGDLILKLDSKEKVEFLVSMCPTFYGEKITLKTKKKATDLLDVTKLGFEENTLKMFLKLLDVPDGLILITSPLNGGKTTTFYAILQYLNRPHLNIVTLEDLIEYSIMGINQSYLENPEKIREKAFQLMDYHPDVFGIGEILNKEAARIALDLSSQTLVLATLTASDTASALLQFFSLVEPRTNWERSLVLDSINCIVSQRLVRQICPTCKEELKPQGNTPGFNKLTLGLSTSSEIPNPGIPPGPSEKESSMPSFYKGKGCADCHQTGYKGLTGLFEIMRITREIKDMVLSEPLTGNLRKILRDLKMTTLEKSGMQKIKNGITSFEEIKRVLAW